MAPFLSHRRRSFCRRPSGLAGKVRVMAYGAEPAGGHSPSHTIYVWPSKELTAKSWYWPAPWHEAFQHAAGRIGLAVALCVLEGQLLDKRQAVLRLSMGTLRISI